MKLSLAQVRALRLAANHRHGAVSTTGYKRKHDQITENTALALQRQGLLKWVRFAQSLNSNTYRITAAGRAALAEWEAKQP
jgi:hypothetical protein